MVRDETLRLEHLVHTLGAGIRLHAKQEHRQDLTPLNELNENPNEERFSTGRLTCSRVVTVPFRTIITAMIVDPTAMQARPDA